MIYLDFFYNQAAPLYLLYRYPTPAESPVYSTNKIEYPDSIGASFCHMF